MKRKSEAEDIMKSIVQGLGEGGLDLVLRVKILQLNNDI